jgi:hypothetical protein
MNLYNCGSIFNHLILAESNFQNILFKYNNKYY